VFSISGRGTVGAGVVAKVIECSMTRPWRAACGRDPPCLMPRRRRHARNASVILHGFWQQASSSIGRAAVSKTAGWGFDSLLACHFQVSDVRHQVSEGGDQT
jgi:hypothetical protein